MTEPVTASRRGWLILAADLVLFFLLVRGLPFAPVENRGLALLACVAVLWLTEASSITVTSLMIPLFTIGLGVLDTRSAFQSFAEPAIFLFLGGFAMAAVLHIQKLDLWMAGHAIRLGRGSLKLTVCCLFAITAFISLFANNTAVAAMMLPLAQGMLGQADVKTHRKLHAFVLLGVAFSASIGGIGTLVGSTPNALLAILTDLRFADWLTFGMPVVLLLMPAMVLSLWVVLRPDFNVPFRVDIEPVPLTGRRVFTLIVFVLAALLLVLGRQVAVPLQQLLGLSDPIRNLDAVLAVLAVVVLCVGGAASWKQIQQHTEWGVLLLFGGALVLAIVVEQTGAGKILADILVQAMGQQHLVSTLLLLAAGVLLLTEFTSNTATAALLMPIFIPVAHALQLPGVALAAIIACGASCAFLLPIATPPNAIAYASGRIRLREMFRAGLLLNIAATFIIGLLAYFWWIHG